MKNLYVKFIALVVSLFVMISGFILPMSALTQNQIENVGVSTSNSVGYGVSLYENRSILDGYWDLLIANNKVSIDDNGQLLITDDACIASLELYDMFMRTVELYNNAINYGIMEVDPVTFDVVSSIEIPEDYEPEYILTNGSNLSSDTATDDYSAATVLRRDPHTCSFEEIDLLGMCEENYAEIEDYYYTVMNDAINRDDAHYMTTVYWINKVKPGGEWDYKVQPGFSPYDKMFCSYYDLQHHHITSEYIGNFNYGYTGSFLYSLIALKTGSFVVSGFDISDFDDWDAIEAGYDYAS